jgi:hypothetical protein
MISRSFVTVPPLVLAARDLHPRASVPIGPVSTPIAYAFSTEVTASRRDYIADDDRDQAPTKGQCRQPLSQHHSRDAKKAAVMTERPLTGSRYEDRRLRTAS